VALLFGMPFAILMVRPILVTLLRAWLEKFYKHWIIARWTLPLCFYASHE
jgi:uncharacterized membrane protein YozB (DUF420 family)